MEPDGHHLGGNQSQALATTCTGSNLASNNLNGLAGNDTITGGNLADRPVARADDSARNGGRQRRALIGGAGNDTLNGGSGNDTYLFGFFGALGRTPVNDYGQHLRQCLA